MDVLKIIVTFLSGVGFWKLIELILHFKTENRLKKAEIRNLNVQANSLVIENYKMWSENMDKRLKELEDKNTDLSKTITKQREEIDNLLIYVHQLEEEIKIYRVNNECK